MNSFTSYLILGLQHILNIQAIDHLLFILSITCVYRIFDIKKLLYLITAFTLGHSVTLGLATLKWISANPTWIEFLIPCTILFSAIGNLYFKENKLKQKTLPWGNYALVAGFGLIHGLHLHKGETLRTHVVAIHDDLDVLNRTNPIEEIEQVALSGVEGQVAYVEARGCDFHYLG